VPKALRGNANACTACILYGDEIGIEPMQALRDIHVVDGRPQPSAELARSLILSAGHSLVVHELTPDLCRASGLRAGQDEKLRTYHQWTTADARRAGLLGKQNWQRYPRAMLLARVTGDLARMLFPDAMKGLGHVDETDVEGLAVWADSITPADPPAAKRTTVRSARKLAMSSAKENPLPEPGQEWQRQPMEPTQDAPADTRPPVAPPVVQQPLQDTEPPMPMAQPMGDAMRKALMANFSDVGIDPTKDRPLRLAMASALLGRPVDTFTQLSRADGLMLFRLLNDIQTGDLMWHDREGTVLLHRVNEDA
jgi:hypothetical protein